MQQNLSQSSEVAAAQIEEQYRYMQKTSVLLSRAYPDRPPLAFVHSFGCQQNVSDGEKIKGMLAEMGYGFTDKPEGADFVLFNTCAVREHAEDRVYGNVGALKHCKADKPDMIIALCGCMVQQEQVAEKIKKSFPYVDLVFGTHVSYQFPEMLYRHLEKGKRVFDISVDSDAIAEGLPVYRDGGFKAWIPIMYGCNNFCTYCIVPYVRGRERSRRPKSILNEIRELAAKGYKEFTLLGQNVNSYGKGLDEDINFAKLLAKVNEIDGDFKIRFMTSHPKDASKELIDVMAACKKSCRHLHLPVQSGSDRILKRMNRGYTRSQYLELIDYARKKMPDLTLSSDIIVGFPGETYEDFLDTVDLIKTVGYDFLYTFLYSKRTGTPAAKFDDSVPKADKSRWFRELLAVQNEIGSAKNRSLVGRELTVLADSVGKSADGFIAGRTEGNIIAEFRGERSDIGRYVPIKITGAMNWAVTGEKTGNS